MYVRRITVIIFVLLEDWIVEEADSLIEIRNISLQVRLSDILVINKRY